LNMAKPRPPCDTPMSYEVWQWPEFQAFAKRLRIDMSLRTVGLTIEFPDGGDQQVMVIQRYRGEDETKPWEETNGGYVRPATIREGG
jgi:hypothetical protein